MAPAGAEGRRVPQPRRASRSTAPASSPSSRCRAAVAAAVGTVARRRPVVLPARVPRVPEQLTHHIDIVRRRRAAHDASAGRHDVVWGGGVRVNRDDDARQRQLSLRSGGSRTYPVASVFAQDDIAVASRSPVRHRRRQVRAQRVQRRRAAAERARALPDAAQPDALGRRLARGAAADPLRRRHRRHRRRRARCSSRARDDFEPESLDRRRSRLPRPAAPRSLVRCDGLHPPITTTCAARKLPPTGPFPMSLGNTLEGESNGVELGVNVQPLQLVAHPRRLHAGWTPTSGARRAAATSAAASTKRTIPASVRRHADVRRSAAQRRDRRDAARGRRAAESRGAARTRELTCAPGGGRRRASSSGSSGRTCCTTAIRSSAPAMPARIEFERSVRVGITFRMP